MEDGFRTWLERAVRVEDDCDWSPHTVDYTKFKQRLKFFARRRTQLRNMLRDSEDGRLSETVVTGMLGPKTPFPSHRGSETPQSPYAAGATHPGEPLASPSSTDYVPFIETSKSTDTEASEGVSVSKKRRNKRSVMRRLSNVERNEMIVFLTWEMDKAQMFYLPQWQRLSQRLEQKQQQRNFTGLDIDLGDEILELIAFCVINLVTATQCLIRYDAFARAFEGTPMLDYYMKQVVKHQTSFRKILYHEELDAIADSYVAGAEHSPFIAQFQAQRYMFKDILSSIEKTDAIASSCQIVGLRDSFIYTLRNWFNVGLFEDRLGLEPAYLTSRGKSLTLEMEQLAEWRKKKHEILRPDEEQQKKELTGMQVYHLTLNMLSAFLYCMNYYIVEPSSTMYVNRLGAHDAMSGTLIGMMPLAAFLSSIPYSMWTNRSFRHPFIMSCLMLIVGNLVYSLADQFGVVTIALAGRFVAGLGAPKCIIRRYMADTTPVSLRTSVNAGFGMVVAAGSAMGPAMAIMLNKFELTVAVPGLGIVVLNGLTLPGYFMAMLWFTFTVIVLLTFEEPGREGLEEQKQLEMSGAIPCSPTNQSEPFDHPTDELRTIFSNETHDYEHGLGSNIPAMERGQPKWLITVRRFFDLITLPVRLCLGLLLAKVFTIEALVSATSALSKNRYKWQVQQVGTLGFINGLLVIPFSILVGRLSMSHQDHVLMKWLVGIGCFGMFMLIDISDLVSTSTGTYNEGNPLAVNPPRYIVGYFLSYISIQSFEGVIGSSLSKVIPTALASGTVNSGLLATLVDTFGRACGDLFISMVGFINLRQLMNLLFIPGFCIMLTCLIVIRRYRDMLSV